MLGKQIRKLEYLLAEAVASGATHVITAGAVQSNHCRATAIAAASLGLECELILRGSEPTSLEGNLLLSKLAGAHCHYVTKETWGQLSDVFELIESMLEQRGAKPYSIPIGGSNPLGVWGYARMIEELKNDMESVGIKRSQILLRLAQVEPMQGILAGLTAYEATASHQAIGVLVSDTVAYFQTRFTQTSVFGPISLSAKRRFRNLFWTIGLSGKVMERPGLLFTNSFEKPLNKKVYSLIPYILRRRSRECWLESRRALFQRIT